MREVVSVVPGNRQNQSEDGQQPQITFEMCQTTLMTPPNTVIKDLVSLYPANWKQVMKKLHLTVQAKARLQRFHQNRQRLANNDYDIFNVKQHWAELLGKTSFKDDFFMIERHENDNFIGDYQILMAISRINAYIEISLLIPPNFPIKSWEWWQRVTTLDVSDRVTSKMMKLLSKCGAHNIQTLSIPLYESYGLLHLVKASLPRCHQLYLNVDTSSQYSPQVRCLRKMRSLPRLYMHEHVDSPRLIQEQLAYVRYTTAIIEERESRDEIIQRWTRSVRYAKQY